MPKKEDPVRPGERGGVGVPGRESVPRCRAQELGKAVVRHEDDAVYVTRGSWLREKCDSDAADEEMRDTGTGKPGLQIEDGRGERLKEVRSSHEGSAASGSNDSGFARRPFSGRSRRHPRSS
jgi:hypothetical protein